MGTPEYMAPESLTKTLSPPVAKDVYSLGVTLFRMLTGRLPFSGDTPAALAALQRQSRPPLARHYRPEIPRELADLVGRMLAKQPIRRPQNLRSLVREMVDLELLLISTELNEAGESLGG
jgi:serine/threonine-protein kinase